MMKKKTAAVVLAAGQGKRMNSNVAKQYLLIKDKPVLYYSLAAFEESVVNEIILVTGAGEEEFCQKEIVEKYNFKKVKKIVKDRKGREVEKLVHLSQNEIDEKERDLQKAHVSRLTKNKCTPQAGMIFSDVVSGLERVADHATNIAFSIHEKDGIKYLD